MKYSVLTILAASAALHGLAHAEMKSSSKIEEPMVQLQIFLDQKLFGPGKIDGRGGEFTTKALKRYQLANGLPETDTPEGLPLETITPVYTTYTIQQGDLKFIGNCPTSPQEQAKVKYLPYDSLLEFLTERFHCAPEFLEAINPGVKLGRLKVGDVVKVPNVEPFKIEELGRTGEYPRGARVCDARHHGGYARENARSARRRQTDRESPDHAWLRLAADAARHLENRRSRAAAHVSLG